MSKLVINANAEIRLMRVRDLQVHPTVQRDDRDEWVLNLKENYHELGLGVLIAIEINGVVLLIDGAHRYRVLVELEKLDFEIPVLVYYDLPIPEQIKVFKMLNTRRPVAQYDLYSLGLKEGNNDDLEVEKLTKATGWTVGKKSGSGTIGAVSVLKKMVRLDPEAAEYALRTAPEIYGYTKDAGSGEILRGFFNFYREHGDELSKTRSRGRLLKEYPTASLLKSKCYIHKRRNKPMHVAVSDSMAHVIFG